MIQMLHSELDADRIDYLLRDAMFSGTTYGDIEAETLIENLKTQKHKKYDIKILGIGKKAINAANQFLVNRFFAFTQIVFHKKVIALERMAQDLIIYLILDGEFPNVEDLIDGESNIDLIDFTDSYFFRKLDDIDCENEYIMEIKKQLKKYRALNLSDKSNTKLYSSSYDEKAEAYKKLINDKEFKMLTQNANIDRVSKDVFVFNSKKITDHIPKEQLERIYNNLNAGKNDNEVIEGLQKQHDIETILKFRQINGLSVVNEETGFGNFSNSPELIVDSNLSLITELCRYEKFFLNHYLI